MTPPLVFGLPGNEAMASRIAALVGADLGEHEARRFPDGESYIRLRTSPSGRSVVLVCTLDHPDPKFLQLVYTAAVARDLGARSVGLVAPYLAYLRQDKRFKEGEAITSRTFAKLVSSSFDWVVTVDPHLHRYSTLSDVYAIPTATVAAAPAMAEWIRAAVSDPFIIGPDAESEQWVAEVARSTGAPYRVLNKVRSGDRHVQVTVPDLQLFADRTPIIVDDIVSSGETMLATLRHIGEQQLRKPACLGVHALFSDTTLARLNELASVVVTTNTVANASNGMDIAPYLAQAITPLLGGLASSQTRLLSEN